MANLFITGGTGFIGRKLISSLLKSSDVEIIFLLVRDTNKASIALEKQIESADESGKKIILLQGDVEKENFGVSGEDIKKLKSVSEVYHLASIISLSNNEDARESIMKTNVGGIGNLIRLFYNLNKDVKFFFFSTAYSCGETEEKVMEDWVPRPIGFRNHYEESKWLAEQEIKKFAEVNQIKFTILRPSIVSASDSSDYKELLNQTFYYFSRTLKKGSEIDSDKEEFRLLGSPNATSNIISVSDLVRLVAHIRTLEDTKRFYNLVNPKNLDVSSFLQGIEAGLNKNVKFSFQKDLQLEQLSSGEKYIYDRTGAYVGYNMIDNLIWNCSNTDEVRKTLNLPGVDNEWIKEHIIDFFSFLKNER
jgi:nucleoside-diphosphate-sugar epimerase|tara:strand:+ start:2338 stop:3423 length:1086 start_codon:yes stop_codon:yes gene_type:complete